MPYNHGTLNLGVATAGEGKFTAKPTPTKERRALAYGGKEPQQHGIGETAKAHAKRAARGRKDLAHTTSAHRARQ